MTGSEIFLTMTALPDSDAATSLVLMPRPSNRRRMASATAAPSMIAPSTILSGGGGPGAQPGPPAGWPPRVGPARLGGGGADVEPDERLRSTKHRSPQS